MLLATGNNINTANRYATSNIINYESGDMRPFRLNDYFEQTRQRLNQLRELKRINDSKYQHMIPRELH